MNEDRKIKFAIVGSGHIGKRHAEMIRRNPESELVAMCDIKDKSEIGLSDVDVPDRKSTRLNSSHLEQSRMPSSA